MFGRPGRDRGFIVSASELRNALQGTSEVDLTVTGRKSGQESTRPIWFVEEGDRLLLLPVSGSDSNWYRNILKTAEIRLDANGAGHHQRPRSRSTTRRASRRWSRSFAPSTARISNIRAQSSTHFNWS